MAKPTQSLDCKPALCDLARKFCMLGATDDDLPNLLDVEPDTLARWIAEVPKFAAALKQGREVADATAAERLFARAIGYSQKAEKIMQVAGEPRTVTYTEYHPPDTTALVIWLKNRQPARWRDKVTPPVEPPLDIAALLDAATRDR
jgi:hypothetical protein